MSSRFRYVGVRLAGREVACSYDLDGRAFTETVTLPDGPGLDTPALAQVARLLFLLAGVSYFKTSAPPVVDLADTPVTDADRALLQAFYVEGLGEYAVVNDLDLTGLRFEGGLDLVTPTPYGGASPLVPFGGGIDSVVVAEAVKAQRPDAALFVLGRYDAIEAPLAVTGLPVVRAARRLDPQVLARDPSFRNGHVPVTGILSCVALASAVATGRGPVVMSNEHSASEATVVRAGREVNHQWSKSREFEQLLRDALAASVPGLDYFSLLRARSELWVAGQFAALPAYHPVFRSCNRAFTIDASRRLTQWCGECDKCCFIDLILAPYLSRTELGEIFAGREPLDREDLLPQFRSLLGDDELDKPFECVGDAGECRTATVLAAARPDRSGSAVLQALLPMTANAPDAAVLLAPIGTDFAGPPYAAAALV
jgi:hypothetical protein